VAPGRVSKYNRERKQQVDLAQLAADYGDYVYPIVFILTFLEGETFVIFGGVLAHQGYLDWWLLFFSAWIGSFCGDQLYFWIGRRWGQDLLVRFPKWRGSAEGALYFLRRYNTWFILSFRFIYGVRNLASFAIGMSGVPPLRFLALNFVAAFVWALSFAGFGYVFGQALEAVLGDIVHTFGMVMLGIFAAVIGTIVFVHRQQQRRFAQRAALRGSLVTGDSAPPA
jgi:membrane protein DedA with SNARE-associated domain